jgi:TonB family protein
MKKVLPLVAVALVASSSGRAAPVTKGGGFGGAGGSSSPYLEVPTAQEFFQYYPERARKAGITGRAFIVCTVMQRGTVNNCTLVSETPAGFEFGSAALKLSMLFRMKLTSQDGKSTVGTKVSIPIRFVLKDASPGDDAIVTSPVIWAKQPTLEELEQVRPATLGGGGSAVIQCHVAQNVVVSLENLGRLTGCTVVDASNSAAGAAALRLTPKFQMIVTYARATTAESIVQPNLVWPAKK